MKYVPIILSLSLALVMTGCSSGTKMQQKPLVSWNTMRWQNVKPQQEDYSCGAGALSTLIEYYFNDPAPEQFILRDLFGRLDPATLDGRKKTGFSMQDLKVQAESMGYIAAGVKLTAEVLPKLKGPVIVLLEGEEANHFVVLKGLVHGKVFLADSRRGNIRMSVDTFLPKWSGQLALVLGKRGYGLPTDHLLGISRPIASAEWVPPEIESWRMNQHQLWKAMYAVPRMNFVETIVE